MPLRVIQMKELKTKKIDMPDNVAKKAALEVISVLEKERQRENSNREFSMEVLKITTTMIRDAGITEMLYMNEEFKNLFATENIKKMDSRRVFVAFSSDNYNDGYRVTVFLDPENIASPYTVFLYKIESGNAVAVFGKTRCWIEVEPENIIAHVMANDIIGKQNMDKI